MGKELKPCPRCGGKVMLWHSMTGEWSSMWSQGWPSIWCPECETLWHPAAQATEIVTDWWNRREGE